MTSYTQADFQALPDRQREIAWVRYKQLMAVYQSLGAPVGTRLSRRELVAYLQQAAPQTISLSVASSLSERDRSIKFLTL